MASEAKLVGAPPLPAIDAERARRKPVNRAATGESGTGFAELAPGQVFGGTIRFKVSSLR